MLARGSVVDGLFVLLGLAFLIAPFAAFFMALGARHRLTFLEGRLADLSDRVDRLAPPVTPAPPGTGLADFEERFGTKWVVWIGGLSLALGGIFLVRYAIDRELIVPSVRVALGALLAATLLVLGEWTRRQETLTGLVGLPRANIPAILTAAGTTVAY